MEDISYLNCDMWCYENNLVKVKIYSSAHEVIMRLGSKVQSHITVLAVGMQLLDVRLQAV